METCERTSPYNPHIALHEKSKKMEAENIYLTQKLNYCKRQLEKAAVLIKRLSATPDPGPCKLPHGMSEIQKKEYETAMNESIKYRMAYRQITNRFEVQTKELKDMRSMVNQILKGKVPVETLLFETPNEKQLKSNVEGYKNDIENLKRVHALEVDHYKNEITQLNNEVKKFKQKEKNVEPKIIELEYRVHFYTKQLNKNSKDIMKLSERIKLLLDESHHKDVIIKSFEKKVNTICLALDGLYKKVMILEKALRASEEEKVALPATKLVENVVNMVENEIRSTEDPEILKSVLATAADKITLLTQEIGRLKDEADGVEKMKDLAIQLGKEGDDLKKEMVESKDKRINELLEKMESLEILNKELEAKNSELEVKRIELGSRSNQIMDVSLNISGQEGEESIKSVKKSDGITDEKRDYIIEEMKQQIKGLDGDIVLLNNKLTFTEARNKELENKLASTELTAMSLSEKLQEITATSTSNNTEYSQKMEELEKKFIHALEALKDTEVEFEELQEHTESLSQKLELVSEEAFDYKCQVSCRELELSGMEDKIAVLEKENVSLKEEIQGLKSKLDQSSKNVHMTLQTQTESDSKIEALQLELKQSDQELFLSKQAQEKLRGELNELKREVSIVNETLIKKVKEEQVIEAKLIQAQKQNRSYSEKIKSLQVFNSELAAEKEELCRNIIGKNNTNVLDENHHLKERCSIWETKNKELREEITKLNSKAQEDKKKIEEYQCLEDEIEETVVFLETKNTKLKADYEELVEKYEKLEAENQRLNSQQEAQ